MSLAYLDKMIALGMGRVVTVGAFSSGVAGGGAAAVLDLDRPQLAIAVPAGYVLRPILIAAQVQPGAATTDADETEILFAVDSLGMWTGDGTFTSENPSNLNSAFDKGSACRVGSIFSAEMTTTPRNGGTAADPVLDIELAREVQTLELATAAAQNLYLVRLLYQPALPLWITGPATLLGYYGGTVAVVGGFAQVQWVEAPIDLMKKYAEVS